MTAHLDIVGPIPVGTLKAHRDLAKVGLGAVLLVRAVVPDAEIVSLRCGVSYSNGPGDRLLVLSSDSDKFPPGLLISFEEVNAIAIDVSSTVQPAVIPAPGPTASHLTQGDVVILEDGDTVAACAYENRIRFFIVLASPSASYPVGQGLAEKAAKSPSKIGTLGLCRVVEAETSTG